jgi:hypothetical protein
MKKFRALLFLFIFVLSFKVEANTAVRETAKFVSRVGVRTSKINIDAILARFQNGLRQSHDKALREVRNRRAPWNGGYARATADVIKGHHLPDGSMLDIKVLTQFKKSPRVGFFEEKNSSLVISSNTSERAFREILEVLGASNKSFQTTEDGLKIAHITLRNTEYDLAITRIKLIELGNKLNRREIGLDLDKILIRSRSSSLTNR